MGIKNQLIFEEKAEQIHKYLTQLTHSYDLKAEEFIAILYGCLERIHFNIRKKNLQVDKDGIKNMFFQYQEQIKKHLDLAEKNSRPDYLG